MVKDNFNRKKLINLLVKKATGFYYSEEQFELEKNANSSKIASKNNIRKNAKYSSKSEKSPIFSLKKGIKCEKFNYSLKEIINSGKSKLIKKNNQKKLKKFGSDPNTFIKLCCNMEVSNQNYLSDSDNLSLVKKKITTHYVPPDMIAIKILFEIFDKKVDDSEIENLSDEELIKFKNKLLEELENENK